jgi:hypothetical protein
MSDPGSIPISDSTSSKDGLDPSVSEVVDWLDSHDLPDRTGRHRFFRLSTGDPLSPTMADAKGRFSGKDIGAMSLFTKLFEAVHSWRRRRGGTKSRTRKRSDLEMEQLDHRQLLAVNFTGVVTNDFPANGTAGVFYTGDPANNQKPQVPVNLQPYFTTNGFQIDNIALSYDSTTDILSVGVKGAPDGTVAGMDDIAGDSDNNGNSATVNPNVSAAQAGFTDPADMGGTKTIAIEFDFTNSGTPDIVAGFPRDNPNPTPGAAKPFEVAQYLNTGDGNLFDPSNILPQYTGNYFLQNDPNHPNFEFQIDNFSKLYLAETGQALNANTQFAMGAYATNDQDIGVTDENFPLVLTSPVSGFTVAPPTPPTPPPPPPPPPSVSPTVYVNVHENNHVNTAHPSAIRVTVLGSSGFDPTTIVPSTVKLGDPATINTTGASPILNFERNVNHDEFPDETFVFNGLDVSLPSGITTAVIEGETTSGTFFESEVKVFNRDYSYYSTPQINAQQKTWLAYDKANGISTADGAVPPAPVIPKKAQQLAASAAIDDLYAPFKGEKVPAQVNSSLGTAQAASSTSAPTVVSIPTKHGKATKATKISTTAVSSSPTVSLGSYTLGGGS